MNEYTSYCVHVRTRVVAICLALDLLQMRVCFSGLERPRKGFFVTWGIAWGTSAPELKAVLREKGYKCTGGRYATSNIIVESVNKV